MSDPTVRCAIYTRKSTSAGLEQEFNTLDVRNQTAAAQNLAPDGDDDDQQ